MTALNRRMAKLEMTESRSNLNPALTVILESFGAGEYIRAKVADGSAVDRRPDESEEAFKERSVEELRQLEREKNPPAPVLTVRMVRAGGDCDGVTQSCGKEWPGVDPSTSKNRTIVWPLSSTALD